VFPSASQVRAVVGLTRRADDASSWLMGQAILRNHQIASNGTLRAGARGIEIAGRTVRCGNVRILNDRHLPSEGAAAPGLLILNPRMLSEQPASVRLFVFHHECGHHNVGESELQADCWAIDRGVRDGWLDAKGLEAVCQSFEDAPETDTHPSGKRRCRNLDKCFAKSVATLAAKSAGLIAPPSPAKRISNPPPRLVSGPTLVGTGTLRYSDASACAPTQDPIGRLIVGTSATPNGCP
jgi:hypothetical protein